MKSLLAFTIMICIAGKSYAGSFNKDKCMQVHYAWSQDDIDDLGTDLALWPIVYLLFKTDGLVTLVDQANSGSYNKDGKNLSYNFLALDNTPLASYEGRKKGKNKCYTSQGKGCWQGTMESSLGAAGAGVWEGYIIKKSNCL